MFAVIGQRSNGIGDIIKRECDSIVDARRVAYSSAMKGYKTVEIYDTSTAKMVVFSPTGQKIPSTLGDLIGTVSAQAFHSQNSTMFFAPVLVPTPEYARSKGMKFRRYIIQKDGSLGEGF